MPRTVTLAATFPASPERLYSMFLDPSEHTAFSGAPVKIAPNAGAEFSAFEGSLSGTVLQVVPNRLIVMSWRSVNFPNEAVDSTLVLLFVDDPAGGRIELTHVNVPEEDYAGVSHGWEKYYWTPWRLYLEGHPDG